MSKVLFLKNQALPMPNSKRGSRVFLFSLLLWLIAAGLFLAWWKWEIPLISPLSSTSTFRFLTGETPASSNKVVYGFLPYWNLNDVVLQPELTHLSYFSLTIGADGKIITKEDTYAEPGYNKLQSEELQDLTARAKAQNTQVEIVFSQFVNDDIVSFLSNPTAHQNFLTTLDSIILAYPVSGINIDIEYTGPVTDKLRQDFVEFMSALRTHTDTRYKGITISIDMYASAASRYNIWDVPAISQHVDYIVVMAYDFHRRSSSQAGPVAPIFGGKKLWDSDISMFLQDFLKSTRPEKILLGIPFYGYEWQTTARESQAHTFPDTGSTSKYTRVQELLARRQEFDVQEHWNEDALSPYISYTEDGEIYVVYFENSRSISYKLDLANQLDLAGIAIWALGYEGDTRELWEVIQRKL